MEKVNKQENKYLKLKPRSCQAFNCLLSDPHLYKGAAVNGASGTRSCALIRGHILISCYRYKHHETISQAPASASLPPYWQTHMYLSHQLTPTRHNRAPTHPHTHTHTPHLNAHRNVRGMTQSTKC